MEKMHNHFIQVSNFYSSQSSVKTKFARLSFKKNLKNKKTFFIWKLFHLIDAIFFLFYLDRNSFANDSLLFLQ